MRPLLLADLDMAARVLLAVPADRRVATMDDLIAQAMAADIHRKRTGQTLPGGGDGSILAAALGRHRVPACIADEAYRASLAVVLRCLGGRSEVQGRL